MVRRRTVKEKIIQRKIAKKRIKTLFTLAEKEAKKHRFDRANRYLQLARRIGMKYLLPLPKEYKHLMCKKCYRFLLPGVTSRVRVSRGKIIISCLYCKHCKRIPLREKTFRYP